MKHSVFRYLSYPKAKAQEEFLTTQEMIPVSKEMLCESAAFGRTRVEKGGMHLGDRTARPA